MLPPVDGMSGSKLDSAVIATFSTINTFLNSTQISYLQYNSNSVIAAGLLMMDIHRNRSVVGSLDRTLASMEMQLCKASN